MSTHYALRGSNSPSGVTCGAFCSRSNDNYGDRYWHFGAVLSFKLDRLNLFSYI